MGAIRWSVRKLQHIYHTAKSAFTSVLPFRAQVRMARGLGPAPISVQRLPVLGADLPPIQQASRTTARLFVALLMVSGVFCMGFVAPFDVFNAFDFVGLGPMMAAALWPLHCFPWPPWTFPRLPKGLPDVQG